MKSLSTPIVAILLVLFSTKWADGFTAVKRDKRSHRAPKSDVKCAKEKLGKLGEHECRYKTIKVSYKVKALKSLRCRRVFRPCLNPNYPPFVTCTTVRCTIIKTSVPYRTSKQQNKIVCCPGWKRNHSSSDLGCSIPTCNTLSQFKSPTCQVLRRALLQRNRRIYRFTNPPNSPPAEEITGKNIFQFCKAPVLNLTVSQVAHLALRNPHEVQWAHAYFAMNGLVNGYVKTFLDSGRFDHLKNFTDYFEILDAFRKRLSATGLRKFCRFPSNEEAFKDIVTNDIWQDDKVFVEQRLAGLNPMSIRRLTLKEYIKRRSQFNRKLDKEIEKVSKGKSTMMKMVKKGLVYILDYPEMNNITTMPDITDLNSKDQRQMKSSTSPIAIFVSLVDCFSRKRELKPLAIQADFTASSAVATPADGLKWLLAKEQVQRADMHYVQIVEHLLKTHLLLGTVCTSMQRALSIYHPLNDILKYHCRGVLVTNSLAFPVLLYPNASLHKLFTTGNVGSFEMLNNAFPKMSWDDTNFIAALKKRGMNDASKVPYFPYRDDGIILWKLVREFARELIDLYYHNTKLVLEDKEIQDLANELSDKGTGPDGGKGMVKNFPNKIKSKWLLAETVARIIFIVVQHSAVNYPVAYYAGFVPNMPSKLYDDPRAPAEEFSIHRLPRAHVATPMVGLSMTLGAMRYDNLFDYHSQLQDRDAGQLVAKYYKYLMGPVLKELKWRNQKRLSADHLTYPYFQPGWLPNSIHT